VRLKTANGDLARLAAREESRAHLLPRGRRVSELLFRDAPVAYAFIAPAFFLLLFLIAYPFALSVWLSLSDARVGDTGIFIGLGNFRRLLGSSIFLQTFQNSIVFTAVSVGAKTVLGMGLALLLFRVARFKRLIRGAVLLPFIVPTALSTLVWWWMFEPLYSVVNWTLKHLHLVDHDIPWPPDPYLAMFAVILVNTWRGLPFFAITLLAGLMAIPRELYEAAEVDGAGAVGRFWHVTIPLIKPVLAIVILFSAIFTLSDFNIVYVLTRGGADEHDAPLRHLFVRAWLARRADRARSSGVPVPLPHAPGRRRRAASSDSQGDDV
jgi:multiple sugar transport system permease protein